MTANHLEATIEPGAGFGTPFVFAPAAPVACDTCNS